MAAHSGFRSGDLIQNIRSGKIGMYKGRRLPARPAKPGRKITVVVNGGFARQGTTTWSLDNVRRAPEGSVFLTRPRRRKSDLRPGMVVYNLVSGNEGQVLGKRGRLLSCHHEFVVVRATTIHSRRRTTWRIQNLKILGKASEF